MVGGKEGGNKMLPFFEDHWWEMAWKAFNSWLTHCRSSMGDTVVDQTVVGELSVEKHMWPLPHVQKLKSCSSKHQWDLHGLIINRNRSIWGHQETGTQLKAAHSEKLAYFQKLFPDIVVSQLIWIY